MKTSFYARYGLPLIMAAVFLQPIVMLGSRVALESHRNQVRDWVAPELTAGAEYAWFHRQFPQESSLIVSWEGCTLDDPRLDVFVQKMSVSPHFSKATSGRQALTALTAAPLGLSREDALARLTGTWIGPDRARSLDGSVVQTSREPRTTCAILTLSQQAQDDPHPALAALETAATACAIPRDTLHLSGPLAENIALDREGVRRLNLWSALGGGIGLLLSIYFLRHRRLALLAFIGAAYSAGLSFAIVTYAGQRVDALLLTMPAVVYTTALSGALHIINYYRRAVIEEGVAGAVDRALRQAVAPCLLSASATAIALFSLTGNELIPIMKFGLFTALGVVASLLVLFTYLPSALTLWKLEGIDRTSEAEERRTQRGSRRLRTVVERIVQWRYGLAAAGVVIVGGCGWFVFQAKTSVGLMSLFSAKSEIVKSYAWLEEKIGPQTPLEVVVRLDGPRTTATESEQAVEFAQRLDLVQCLETAVRGLNDEHGLLSAATFAPEQRNATEGVPYRMGTASRAALLATDFLTERNGEELWRMQVRVSALRGGSLQAGLRLIQQTVEPILADAKSNGVTGIRGATYTGLSPLVEQAQQYLLSSLLENLGWAAVLFGAALAIIYNSVAAGLILTVSIAWPLAVVFGAMSALGIPLDIGAVMTAIVATSASIDNSLHFTQWFRRGTGAGMHHRDAVVYAYLNAAGPILQRSLMVGLGMAVYAGSSFVPTQRFGVLINALLGCGLIADLILTPAFLAGPLAYFFTQRQVMAKQAQVDQRPLENVLPIGAHGIPAPHVGAARLPAAHARRANG